MRRVVLIVSVSLATAVASAGAQTIRGRVLNESTGLPVVGAKLTLFAGDSAIALATVNDSGRYVLKAPRAGEFKVQLVQDGFITQVIESLQLRKGQIMELPMPMPPEPPAVVPETLDVSPEPRIPPLDRVGFFTRKKAGRGHFIERPAIEASKVTLTSDLLKDVNGVRQVKKPKGDGHYVFLRASLSTSASTNPGRRGAVPNPFCAARVFVDGMVMNPPSEPYDFEQLNPRDIEAIEIYRSPAELPPQFGGTESACGAVLVWRRH